MAHTILNSFFVNLVVKRKGLLDVKILQYTVNHGHKHYKPEYKKHRSLKNALLPMYTNKTDLPTEGPNSVHTKFRPQSRYWNEPRTVSSHTYSLMDPYDPIKDEERTWLNPKDAFEKIKLRRKDKKAIRDIQSFDEHFDIQDFIEEAEEIYIKANESITEKDEDKMLEYLTPPAYLIARESTHLKRVHWKFLKTIDPPKPLRARAVIPQGNDEAFAQITVRFHSQQILAVYDRFGRLMMGSEILAKDVLELVVFERRLTHAHGKWRVHDKIPIPENATARTMLTKTKIREVIEEGVEQQQEIETAEDVSTQPQITAPEQKQNVPVEQK